VRGGFDAGLPTSVVSMGQEAVEPTLVAFGRGRSANVNGGG
jgi:hypothetical protein